MSSLVVKGSDEVLISWQLLMKLKVIAPTFPKVMDSSQLFRILQGVSLEDAFVKEGGAIFESTKNLE